MEWLLATPGGRLKGFCDGLASGPVGGMSFLGAGAGSSFLLAGVVVGQESDELPTLRIDKLRFFVSSRAVVPYGRPISIPMSISMSALAASCGPFVPMGAPTSCEPFMFRWYAKGACPPGANWGKLVGTWVSLWTMGPKSLAPRGAGVVSDWFSEVRDLLWVGDPTEANPRAAAERLRPMVAVIALVSEQTVSVGWLLGISWNGGRKLTRGLLAAKLLLVSLLLRLPKKERKRERGSCGLWVGINTSPSDSHPNSKRGACQRKERVLLFSPLADQATIA